MAVEPDPSVKAPWLPKTMLTLLARRHRRVGYAAHVQEGVSAVARFWERMHVHYTMRASGSPDIEMSHTTSIARVFWLAKWARRDFDCLWKTIRAVVRAGDTVADIGALYGWYSYLLAIQVGPTGLVHILEPNRSACDIVESLLGKFDQVRLHRIGAGNSDTNLTFTIAKVADLSSFVFSGTDELVARRVMVPVRRLDKEVPEPIRFCKIDVEGFEPEVIQGMSTLPERPFIFAEKPADTQRATSFFSQLLVTGHQVYAVPNWSPFDFVPIRQLMNPEEVNWPDTWTDAIAIPEVHKTTFDALIAGRKFRKVAWSRNNSANA